MPSPEAPRRFDVRIQVQGAAVSDDAESASARRQGQAR